MKECGTITEAELGTVLRAPTLYGGCVVFTCKEVLAYLAHCNNPIPALMQRTQLAFLKNAKPEMLLNQGQMMLHWREIKRLSH